MSGDPFDRQAAEMRYMLTGKWETGTITRTVRTPKSIAKALLTKSKKKAKDDAKKLAKLTVQKGIKDRRCSDGKQR